MLQEFNGFGAGDRERTDLVVFTVHHQYRDIDRFEVVVEFGLGKDADAFVLGDHAAHHALPPPVPADAFGNDGAGAIEAIERQSNVDIKLRTMVRRAIADAIHHFFRHTVGVFIGLHEEGRDGADEHGFGDPALAVPRNVPGHFTAAGGMADVNRIF